MNFYYINVEPMICSISDGLQFNDEPVDPYDERQPTYDEVRQQAEDDLDDILIGIGHSLDRLGNTTFGREQAE